MHHVNVDRIKPVLEDKEAVLEAVRLGFIQHAQGKITLPEPVQLLFHGENESIAGDCHIKTASSNDLPFFCIKVATGFYKNPDKGLPVNDGLVILMSSETGNPLALFQDEGHLTSVRTAAAGALAASLIDDSEPLVLGVIGTGHQAELQALWISYMCQISKVKVWGRSQDKARKLEDRLSQKGLAIEVSETISDVCAQSRILVTTTPSMSPLVLDSYVKPGHHIIAIGSDSPGKIELDPEIMKRADVILTDDHNQCLHHGEFGHAVRAEFVKETSDISFGKALQKSIALGLSKESVSIVDLTGLGAQDLAIASMVYKNIIQN